MQSHSSEMEFHKELDMDNNGDGGYGLLVVYIGGPAAQANLLVPKVGGHLALFLYSLH